MYCNEYVGAINLCLNLIIAHSSACISWHLAAEKMEKNWNDLHFAQIEVHLLD